MRVGIDGSSLAQSGGIRRYLFEISRELDRIMPDARFFVYAPHPVSLPVTSERWCTRIDELPRRGPLSLTRWLLVRVGRMCRTDKLDIFWAVGGLAPLLPRQVKVLLTVHDLNYKIAPGTMPQASLWMHRLFFARNLRHANAITTNSGGTAKRIFDLFGITTSAVVLPAVSSLFKPQTATEVDACRGKYSLDSPYLLTVGTLEPRKRLDLLMKIFLEMRADGLLPNHTLALAGGKGWKDKGIGRLIASDSSGALVPLGYVPDNDLASLYTGCEAFVFPSLYEGFGLPVLEARACGVRIVTTDIPELREAGGTDAIYVAPNKESFRTGILEALAAPRPYVLRESLRTWNDSAQTLARVLTETAQLN